MRFPETSVRNYHYSLGNNPEERSSHLLRGGGLKSRLIMLLGTLKADSHTECRAHAVPLPCRALIHTSHAAPLPCSDSAVSFVNVRMVAGNIRLLVQQCNIFFVVCCYHSFPRP